MKMPGYSLIPIVLFSAIAPSVLLLAPAIASQLAVQFHWGPGQIGAAISAELGAMSLATFPAYFWLKRLDWRKAALVAILVFVAANGVSASLERPDGLLALRFLSGFAGGSLMIVCISSASLAANPARAYGAWLMGQLVFSAIGFLIVPWVFEAYGLGGAYGGLALLMLLISPALLWLPVGGNMPKAEGKATFSRPALAGVFGTFLFYAGLSAAWTFMGMIGEAASLAKDHIAQALSFATAAGILGAATASFLGGRKDGNDKLTTLGFLLMAVAILALLGLPGMLRFSIAVLCFKFAWTFILPYILAGISSVDRNGHLINTTNLMIGGGLAVGPLLGGYFVEVGGLSSVLILGTILVACSFLLINYLLSAGRLQAQSGQ